MKKYFIIAIFISIVDNLVFAAENDNPEPTISSHKTMGGRSSQQQSYIAGKMTYTRVREQPIDMVKYRKIVSKEADSNDLFLTSCEYALSKFGEKIENLSGNSLATIFTLYRSYGTSYIINQYFDVVEEPQDGDLVVYPNGTLADYIHSGIYKKDGEMVESKWSWGLSYFKVYYHEVLYVPMGYGATVQFYRLKNNEHTSLTTSLPSSGPVYILSDNSYFVFCRNEVNANARLKVDRKIYCGHDTQEVEKISVNMEKMASEFGINTFNIDCAVYAFSKIIPSYLSSPFASLTRATSNNLIEQHFMVVTEPKIGDLVCYYKKESSLTLPQHYGVYCSKDLIESKWGCYPVYRHKPFDVLDIYGDYLRYYRWKL